MNNEKHIEALRRVVEWLSEGLMPEDVGRAVDTLQTYLNQFDNQK